jgi:hypothetical protein
MKRILSVILLLILSNFVFAQGTAVQQKPLTQTEYVKMLYELPKNPGKVTELIEMIRTRGIGFELTDGLRGLTRTKSASNEELKRTLEESDRRRQNPTASKLPSEKESSEIIEKTRQNTLDAIKEMPDFVVKQLIGRAASFAGTNNWKPLDNLIIAVSYSDEKGEEYRVLSINGTPVNAEKGSNYGGLNGATTGGEFVEDLSSVFKAESKTKFSVVDTDVLRGHRTVVFEYEILIENNPNGGIGLKGAVYSSVPTGQKGKIWIDRDSFRVLKLQYQATDIPASFPIKAFVTTIDYDWVVISDQKYLLPIESDARFTQLGNNALFQTKNLIRFKNYQKYGSEVKILDGDEEEVKEPTKPSN